MNAHHGLLLQMLLKVAGYRRSTQQRRSSRSRYWSRSAQTLFASWAVLGQIAPLALAEPIAPSLSSPTGDLGALAEMIGASSGSDETISTQLLNVAHQSASTSSETVQPVLGTGSYEAGGGTADGSYSVAIGDSSSASGYRTVAIGANAQAISNRATAVGTNTTASNNSTSAFGHQATASGYRSQAFGANANATRNA